MRMPSKLTRTSTAPDAIMAVRLLSRAGPVDDVAATCDTDAEDTGTIGRGPGAASLVPSSSFRQRQQYVSDAGLTVRQRGQATTGGNGASRSAIGQAATSAAAFEDSADASTASSG